MRSFLAASAVEFMSESDELVSQDQASKDLKQDQGHLCHTVSVVRISLTTYNA